jgi:UDP-N-acetylmuramyl pentapeptide phosphotransferase/UDP-N-acetylglucosamine-1-phosphate transferase
MTKIPDLALASLIAAGAFIIAYVGTGVLARVLKARAILAHPTERSSHSVPTPAGGGIAVLAGLLPAWLAVAALKEGAPGGLVIVAGLALVLAVLSWIDDLKGLGALVRLAAQAAVVATAMVLAPFPGPVFQGFLPPALDLAATALLWVWFINLFNFMDGIDGIAGVETAAIGAGIFVAAKVAKLEGHWLMLGLSATAAAVGFLRWNWHPAKIFLGDVGSVPLGFLLGWLLLTFAAAGHPIPALILPLYFIADATITLVRRLARGEKVWVAHREHFYQLAIRSGLRHDQVAGIVAVANLFLIALVMVAARGLPLPAISGAVAAVVLLLFLLAKGGPTE